MHSTALRPGPLLACALALLVSACASDGDDASGSGRGNDRTLYHLAGTVALGRPGQWAEVCIDNRCTRADAAGDYRLSVALTGSRLVRAEVPEAGGADRWLTGLYRHQADNTAALVNLNPSTEAILDAWSRYRQGQPLASCLDDDTCRSPLVETFSAKTQATANEQLAKWLGRAWLSARDPFSDLYVADPDQDWLDELHDHLAFDHDATSLGVTNLDGDSLERLDYQTLFTPGAAVAALAEADLDHALTLPVPVPGGSGVIDIDLALDPASAFTAPHSLRADVSDSTSSQSSQLTFRHELVDPAGGVTAFKGALVNTRIDRAGPHIWVVTVTDGVGNTATEGRAVEVLSPDTVNDPTFGAAGSCLTTALTTNSANICEETVDGGLLGACTPTLSGSTITTASPGRCSRLQQHGGELLGVCTTLFNEIRIFQYVNPLRDTGESVNVQREREQGRCENELGGSWQRYPED